MLCFLIVALSFHGFKTLGSRCAPVESQHGFLSFFVGFVFGEIKISVTEGVHSHAAVTEVPARNSCIFIAKSALGKRNHLAFGAVRYSHEFFYFGSRRSFDSVEIIIGEIRFLSAIYRHIPKSARSIILKILHTPVSAAGMNEISSRRFGRTFERWVVQRKGTGIFFPFGYVVLQENLIIVVASVCVAINSVCHREVLLS